MQLQPLETESPLFNVRPFPPLPYSLLNSSPDRDVAHWSTDGGYLIIVDGAQLSALYNARYRSKTNKASIVSQIRVLCYIACRDGPDPPDSPILPDEVPESEPFLPFWTCKDATVTHDRPAPQTNGFMPVFRFTPARFGAENDALIFEHPSLVSLALTMVARRRENTDGHAVFPANRSRMSRAIE